MDARAGQRPAASAEPTAGTPQPAPAAPAPQAQQRPLQRDEALDRLHQLWGPLPTESLDWARGRLGINGSPSTR